MGSSASKIQPAAPSLKRGGGSVHFSVAEAIGRRIVSGEFPPGTVLPNETKWAADFNVSRSAVREAIKILMAKNLLVSRPKVGSRVEPKEHWNLLDQDVLSWYVAAPRQAQFLLSLQQFRYVVEPEAAALAALNHTEEQMQVITTACRDMGKATTLNARTEADVRFHSAILKATNNEFLMPLGAITDQSLNSLFIFITRHADDLRYVQTLHENIARNIRLRKPDAARQAVKRLLKNSDKLIDQYASRNKLDAAPDWTDGVPSQATIASTKEEKS